MAEPAFSYTLHPGRKNGTSIVKIEGQLTLSTIFSFQNELRAMKPDVLILDLTHSSYMDSAGLGVIVNQHVSAENGHRKFLLTGVNHRIEALLEATKVRQVLHIYPSVAEAEASLPS